MLIESTLSSPEVNFTWLRSWNWIYNRPHRSFPTFHFPLPKMLPWWVINDHSSICLRNIYRTLWNIAKVQLDILNSIFGCFGVGGQDAFPPAESILSESHSPKVPKVLFKILYYHDSLLYNQIELWNLLVSFSILFLPKVPNFGEYQNEYENQDLIFRVTTDLGFQIHVWIVKTRVRGIGRI